MYFIINNEKIVWVRTVYGHKIYRRFALKMAADVYKILGKMLLTVFVRDIYITFL